MRKILSAVLFVAVALSALWIVPSGQAASASGPYNGKFTGFVHGDKASQAALTLDLSQRGDQIEGTVTLGQGLYIDAGMCGAAYVPAGQQEVQGRTKRGHPDQLETDLQFTVSGITLVVRLESQVSRDGKQLEAQAKIDLPWLCGRDPIIHTEMVRTTAGG